MSRTINITFAVSYMFITTTAPVTKTLADFWRLIWQEHPPTIVMVTNLKEGEKVRYLFR